MNDIFLLFFFPFTNIYVYIYIRACHYVYFEKKICILSFPNFRDLFLYIFQFHESKIKQLYYFIM